MQGRPTSLFTMTVFSCNASQIAYVLRAWFIDLNIDFMITLGMLSQIHLGYRRGTNDTAH